MATHYACLLMSALSILLNIYCCIVSCELYYGQGGVTVYCLLSFWWYLSPFMLMHILLVMFCSRDKWQESLGMFFMECWCHPFRFNSLSKYIYTGTWRISLQFDVFKTFNVFVLFMWYSICICPILEKMCLKTTLVSFYFHVVWLDKNKTLTL